MNGFIIFFTIIGIALTILALTIIAIYAFSFVIVAIKSFKHNIEAQYQVQKEHINLCAEARKKRVARIREQMLDKKEGEIDRELRIKGKKILLEIKKSELKEQLREAKFEAKTEKVMVQVEKENKDVIHDIAPEEEIPQIVPENIPVVAIETPQVVVKEKIKKVVKEVEAPVLVEEAPVTEKAIETNNLIDVATSGAVEVSSDPNTVEVVEEKHEAKEPIN